jgi:hypothetical protein
MEFVIALVREMPSERPALAHMSGHVKRAGVGTNCIIKSKFLLKDEYRT